MECIECQLQWKVLLLGSVCKHDSTLQHHVPSAVLQSHQSPVTEYGKTSHIYELNNYNAADNRESSILTAQIATVIITLIIVLYLMTMEFLHIAWEFIK